MQVPPDRYVQMYFSFASVSAATHVMRNDHRRVRPLDAARRGARKQPMTALSLIGWGFGRL